MKLASRYFRTNLFATISIFLLAGIAFYFLLGYVMLSQVDDDLKIEQREIENYINEYHTLPEIQSVKDLHTSYEPTDLSGRARNFQTVNSPEPNETDKFREISFVERVGGQNYLFKVSKSLEAMEKMNHSIIIISFVTVLVILLVTLVINHLIFRKLWRPFYNTVETVRQFRLGEKKTTAFSKTQIDEFSLLNTTLEQFISNADREFTSLKEFTENAAHELQTPLAIIRSKLDILVQDENLSEGQGHAAASAYDALKRMVKLNHSLLLLTKIENKQFDNSESLDLKLSIENKLQSYQELFGSKQINIDSILDSAPIKANAELVEILLNNLFSNAYQHTGKDQCVLIRLSKNYLSVSNTSVESPLNPNQLFKRFSKGGQSTDRHGLGLSIVQQICTALGWKISYRHENNLHVFHIDFENS